MSPRKRLYFAGTDRQVPRGWDVVYQTDTNKPLVWEDVQVKWLEVEWRVPGERPALPEPGPQTCDHPALAPDGFCPDCHSLTPEPVL